MNQWKFSLGFDIIIIIITIINPPFSSSFFSLFSPSFPMVLTIRKVYVSSPQPEQPAHSTALPPQLGRPAAGTRLAFPKPSITCNSRSVFYLKTCGHKENPNRSSHRRNSWILGTHDSDTMGISAGNCLTWLLLEYRLLQHLEAFFALKTCSVFVLCSQPLNSLLTLLITTDK